MFSKISPKLFLLALVFTGLSGIVKAQEINATVTVVPKPGMQVTTVDREVIDVLQRVIQEFINNTKWTTELFEVNERITCSFQLTIN